VPKRITTCQCGGDVEALPRSWTCTKCNAALWHEMRGHIFLEDEARQLFETGSSDPLTLTSKQGKPYDGRFVLQDGKVVFEYADGGAGRGR